MGTQPAPAVRRNILAAAASGIDAFIARQGGDAAEVFLRAGVEETRLGEPTLALDLAAYVRMMEVAAAATGNDNFGLWFGQQFQPGQLGLIGEIALASADLGAALANLATLFPFHQQATETRLKREGGLLRLEYRILDGGIVARRQDAELTMGMFANILRHGLGPSWTPEEVHFEHAAPEDMRAHETAFDAAIHFGQRTNALVFREAGLARRLPGSDPARLALLSQRLTRLAGGIGTPDFLDRVKGEIRSALTEQPGIGRVADALGLARWTLQRRLAEEDVSFSDLVKAVRRDMALVYLRQPHLPVAEIGALLGYSEVSAFSRACTGWFGASPQAVRQRLVH